MDGRSFSSGFDECAQLLHDALGTLHMLELLGNYGAHGIGGRAVFEHFLVGAHGKALAHFCRSEQRNVVRPEPRFQVKPAPVYAGQPGSIRMEVHAGCRVDHAFQFGCKHGTHIRFLLHEVATVRGVDVLGQLGEAAFPVPQERNKILNCRKLVKCSHAHLICRALNASRREAGSGKGFRLKRARVNRRRYADGWL